MSNKSLETSVGMGLRTRAEAAIDEAVRQLNAAGYNFEREFEDDCTEWIDRVSGKRLSISHAIGVSLKDDVCQERSPDPIVEQFIALAESGNDREATLLNQLEGEIANGGIYQLFENKGVEFIREAVPLLRGLKARSKANLLREALRHLEAASKVLAGYERLRTQLEELDRRYDRCSENVPALFQAKHGG